MTVCNVRRHHARPIALVGIDKHKKGVKQPILKLTCTALFIWISACIESKRPAADSPDGGSSDSGIDDGSVDSGQDVVGDVIDDSGVSNTGSDSEPDSQTETSTDDISTQGVPCAYTCREHCYSIGGKVMKGDCSGATQKCCRMPIDTSDETGDSDETDSIATDSEDSDETDTIATDMGDSSTTDSEPFDTSACAYTCSNHCHSIGGEVMEGECADAEQKCCDLGGSDTNGDVEDTDTNDKQCSGSCRCQPAEYRNLFKELLGKTDEEIDEKIEAAYEQLFHGTGDEPVYYESGDGAYILDVKHNDVRSEGMSYGMIISALMDRQEEFDKIWKWAVSHMRQPNGYFGWLANSSGWLQSSGSAPDGEEYFATALIFAATRWGDGEGIFNYSNEARNLLHAMISGGIFNYQQHMVKFLTNSSHTDPSYVLPAFYEVWACFDPENADFWSQVAATGRGLFQKATNGATGLAPDYSNFDGSPVWGEHGDFRYDAWRVVMNIMMDYHFYGVDAEWQAEYAVRHAGFWVGQGEDYGSLFNLNGQCFQQDHRLGLVACNATLGFALPAEDAIPFVRELWDSPTISGIERYYDGLLFLLNLLHVSGRFKLYY